ncbi:MAG: hypothetical protein ACI4EN_09570 [Butyrivibrio sp.]
MKFKKIAVIVTMLSIVILGSVPVFAVANSKTIEHQSLDAYLYGYIDFSEGDFIYTDKIAYTGRLYGNDVSQIDGNAEDKDCFITPGTDSKMKKELNCIINLPEIMKYMYQNQGFPADLAEQWAN